MAGDAFPAREAGRGAARADAAAVAELHNVLLHNNLKAVATAGTVNSVDTARVLDLCDQMPQLLWRILGQAREGCLLPEAGYQARVRSGRHSGV